MSAPKIAAVLGVLAALLLVLLFLRPEGGIPPPTPDPVTADSRPGSPVPVAPDPEPVPAPGPPAGAVGKAVTLTVEVLDPDGSPATGAEVVLEPEGIRGTTDARGEVRLAVEGAVNGLALRAAAGDLVGYAWPGAGIVRDTRVRLRLLPAVTVARTVVVRDGPPVAGAEVVARIVLGSEAGTTAARTDSAGRFELRIPRSAFDEPIEVTVLEGPGYLRSTTVLGRPDPPDGEVRIVVEPACRIRGRCVDDRGRPREGVTVSVGVGPGHSAGAGTTDAEGRFDFQAPRKSWALMAGSEGTEPFLLRDVPSDGPEYEAGDLVLEPARLCRVRGRCLGGDGKPLARVDVSTGVGPGHSAGYAKTAEDGAFEIPSRRGTWAVMVGGEVWWRDVLCEGDEVDVGTGNGPAPEKER